MVEMSCLLYGCWEGERGKKERERIEKETEEYRHRERGKGKEGMIEER